MHSVQLVSSTQLENQSTFFTHGTMVALGGESNL
jgi:hypothetical protein